MTTQLSVVEGIFTQFQVSLENQDYSLKFLHEWVLNQNMSLFEFYYWEYSLEPSVWEPKWLIPYQYEGVVLILHVDGRNFKLVDYDHTTYIERVYLSRSRKSVMVQYTALGYDDFGNQIRGQYTSAQEYKSLLK